MESIVETSLPKSRVQYFREYQKNRYHTNEQYRQRQLEKVRARYYKKKNLQSDETI